VVLEKYLRHRLRKKILTPLHQGSNSGELLVSWQGNADQRGVSD
jgi:hypothetical protein